MNNETNVKSGESDSTLQNDTGKITVRKRNKSDTSYKENLSTAFQQHTMRNAQENWQAKSIRKPYQKLPKKLNKTKNLLKNCIEMYEHQTRYLKKILEEPLSHIPLTPEELNKLFTKYKLDGHYRTDSDNPPLGEISNNMHEKISTTNHQLELVTWRTHTNNIGESFFENAEKSFGNFYCNTDAKNQNICKDNQGNMTHHYSQNLNKEFFTMDKFDIVQPCMGQTPFDCNCKQTSINSEQRECNATNMIASTQDCSQLDKLNSCEISDKGENYFCVDFGPPKTSMRIVEDCQNPGYANTNYSCDITKSNVGNEVFQCQNTHCTTQNNLNELNIEDSFKEHQFVRLNMNPINSSFTGDNNFSINRWDNHMPLNSRDNHLNKSCNGTQSTYVPHASDFEYVNNKYNINNSTIVCQSTNISLIKNHSNEQNNFNSYTGAKPCPFVDNGNSAYDFCSNSTDGQHNFSNFLYDNSTYTSSMATVMSGAFNLFAEMDDFGLATSNTQRLL